MSDLRPRRSVLYMPAANERALDKAKGIPADALIFDLEDTGLVTRFFADSDFSRYSSCQ